MTERADGTGVVPGSDARREAAGRGKAPKMALLIAGVTFLTLVGAACLVTGGIVGPGRGAGMGLIAAGVALVAAAAVLGRVWGRRVKTHYQGGQE